LKRTFHVQGHTHATRTGIRGVLSSLAALALLATWGPWGRRLATGCHRAPGSIPTSTLLGVVGFAFSRYSANRTLARVAPHTLMTTFPRA
jgi:hypothetical protein